MNAWLTSGKEGDRLPCAWSALAMIVGIDLAGCTVGPAAPGRTSASALPSGAGPAAEADVSPGATAVDAAAAVPESTPTVSVGDDRTAFATRYAYFEPANWNELPGWTQDAAAEAWTAFRRTCGVLGRRTGWSEVCSRAAAFRPASDGEARKFLEREFSLYAIRNKDRSPEGVITGYYEPLLSGSRSRGGPFQYPVLATPSDLLTVDIRSVPRELRGQPIGVRVEGRQAIPVLTGSAPYVLDVGDLQSDVRDKKLRVRIEGRRIVPYPTRAQIARDGLPKAQVLAWVDNPAALYSMQVQGSGKVRLADGRIVRLAYADQNGHPFRPPIRRSVATKAGGGVTTRGLGAGVPNGNAEEDDDLYWREVLMHPDEAAQAEPLTRGGLVSRSTRTPPAAGSPPSGGALTPEVEALIEDLASGREIGGAGPRSAAPSRPSAKMHPESAPTTDTGKPAPSPSLRPEVKAAPTPAERPGAGSARVPPTTTRPVAQAPAPPAIADAAPMTFPQPSAAVREALLSDPSYVFFREIPDGPEGPIGALGVPLTAGRSVAVDPRTTPLGFPVFVSTTEPGRAGRLNRLVMAQDTGGAIRGAVRADYFWGFGASAYAQAARMKERGRMWVLFPRALPLAAREQAVRTRGAGGAFADVDCVVEDPELCVEDR